MNPIYNETDPLCAMRRIEEIKREIAEEQAKEKPDQEKINRLLLRQFNAGLALSTIGNRGLTGSFRPY